MESSNRPSHLLSSPPSTTIPCWCHSCKQSFFLLFQDSLTQCPFCQSQFCERIEQFEGEEGYLDPRSFEPYQYSVPEPMNDPENSLEALSLENSSQRNTSWHRRSPSQRQQTPPRNFVNNRNTNLIELPTEANQEPENEGNNSNAERNGSSGVLIGPALQNSELVSRIIEMALQRIRNNNSAFQNTVLTRAHIRVVGNQGQQPFRLRRLLPELGQNGGIGGNIYNTSPQGIFQDILEDLLEVPTTSNASPFSNGGGFFSNYFEQIIQQLSENDLNRFGPPPASKESIRQLKRFEIKDFNNNKSASSLVECCVCQELFSNYDVNSITENDTSDCFVIEMPCLHIFHEACLMPWLEKHNSCPTCRYELPTDDPDYEQRKVSQRIRQQSIQQNNGTTNNQGNIQGNNQTGDTNMDGSE